MVIKLKSMCNGLFYAVLSLWLPISAFPPAPPLAIFLAITSLEPSQHGLIGHLRRVWRILGARLAHCTGRVPKMAYTAFIEVGGKVVKKISGRNRERIKLN
jgi:uncharacterized protein (DUF1810 family)